MTERIQEVLVARARQGVQCAFDGRRIVIFPGGPAQADEARLDEIRAMRGSGGFDSVIGRIAFQRGKPDAPRMMRRGVEPPARATAKAPPRTALAARRTDFPAGARYNCSGLVTTRTSPRRDPISPLRLS